MAITIQQQPQAFCPVYNEVMYVVSSTNTGNTNFKFVCDIWQAGGSSYTARVLLNTIPGTNQCVFDAHRILENYLSSDAPANGGFDLNNNSYLRFYVQFGEQYGSTPAVYANLATSAQRTAYNGIFDYLDFVGYDYTQWQLNAIAPNARNCLTNAPLTQYIEANQLLSLYFAPSGANSVAILQYKTYDKNNALINSYQISNTHTGATDYHQRVEIGTLTLSGTGDDPNCDHYTVQLLNSTTQAVSQLYTLYIVCNPKYTTKRLHFMNKPGGFDAFNFQAIHRQQSNIARQTYRKNTGSLSGSSWTNTVQDKGLTVYDTTVDDTMHLISGYISEAESKWLEELFTSPQIYLESDGELLPYVVTSNTYSVKEKEADKLFNIEIDIQPAVQRRRQRG